MARQFALGPTHPTLPSVGFIVSLVIHTALALPFVLPRPDPEPGEGPIDRLVVFLVPPDVEGGRSAERGTIDWSGLKGDGGAVEKDAEPEPDLEPFFTEGTAGEPEIDPEPLGDPFPPTEETALTEIEVDSMVERDPSSVAPVYPEEMLEKNMEGATFVNYVVDTTGRVDTLTIRVIRSTHVAFTRSVRDALAQMRFRPAIQGSRKVRQWVEQNFAFRIQPRGQAPDTGQRVERSPLLQAGGEARSSRIPLTGGDPVALDQGAAGKAPSVRDTATSSDAQLAELPSE